MCFFAKFFPSQEGKITKHLLWQFSQIFFPKSKISHSPFSSQFSPSFLFPIIFVQTVIWDRGVAGGSECNFGGQRHAVCEPHEALFPGHRTQRGVPRRPCRRRGAPQQRPPCLPARGTNGTAQLPTLAFLWKNVLLEFNNHIWQHLAVRACGRTHPTRVVGFRQLSSATGHKS